jgi:hypothetical protein
VLVNGIATPGKFFFAIPGSIVDMTDPPIRHQRNINSECYYTDMELVTLTIEANIPFTYGSPASFRPTHSRVRSKRTSNSVVHDCQSLCSVGREV